MLKYTVLAIALAITPAKALTIDLMATPTGDLAVYNPYDREMLFHFYGGGAMMVPTGFNMGDQSTWHLATSASYVITVSGGAFPFGSMSICNDVTNTPPAHACGAFQPSGHGYIGIAPGLSTLHWAGYMSWGYSGYATLLSASLSVDDQWFRSPPYIDEFVATTPIPGALPLFASGVALLGYLARRRFNGRTA
jgi:hypothetical protein